MANVDEDQPLIINVNDGDVPLAQLLSEWNMLYLFQKLNEAGITYESLSNITEGDLDVLFPQFKEIGVKIKFRSEIVKWRKQNGFNEHASTLSASSSFNPLLLDWIKSTEAHSNPSSPTPSTSSIPQADYVESSAKNVIDNMFKITHITDLLKSLNHNSSNATRDLLCNKITSYLLENKITRLNRTEFQNITDLIVSYCPLENGEFYFQDGKVQKGRLYYKYRNYKTNLRQIGILDNRSSSKRIKLSSDDDQSLVEEHLDDDSDEAKEWLKYHTEPWATVERNWKTTASIRLNSFRNSSNKNIGKFIKDWPLLKCSQGYHLEKSMSLLKIWTDEFSKKMYAFLSNGVKDKVLQEAAKKLDSLILADNSLNGENNLGRKNFIIAELFRQLNGFLVPTGRKKQIKNHLIWKPSIVESFDSFINYVTEAGGIKKIVECKQQKYAEFGLSVQPSLFAEVDVANSIINKIYLYFDDIFYMFDNILNAVDISFKLCFVLNLKYPFECAKIYKFLEYVVYNISDKKHDTPFEIINLRKL